MDDEQLNALAEALDGGEPQEPVEPQAAAEDAAGEPGEDLAAAGGDEPAETPEEDAGETPEGVSKLRILNADGEPEEVDLDQILAETQIDVEVDGETQMVNIDELKKGYMLQSDYSKKTEEVARQREEMAPYGELVAFAKSDPQFVQYLQAYFQNGGDPVAGLSAHPNISDAQLSQMLVSDDPEVANQAREIARNRAETNAAMQQRRQQMEQVQQERVNQFNVWKDAETRRAREVITDYDSALKGKDEYLAQYGFTPQEIASLVDHRYVRVLADALKVRQLAETRTSTKSELAAKRKQPRPPRATRSSRGKQTDSGQQRARNLEKRARESGSTEAWADVIGDRLGLK